MKRSGIFLIVAAFGMVTVRAQESVRLGVLVETLGKIENPEVQANILRGMNASLQGQRGVTVPAAWPALYEKLKASPNEEVRQQAQALAAAFGGGSALDGLRKTLADSAAKPDARHAALDSLLAAKDALTLPLLLKLVRTMLRLKLWLKMLLLKLMSCTSMGYLHGLLLWLLMLKPLPKL